MAATARRASVAATRRTVLDTRRRSAAVYIVGAVYSPKVVVTTRRS